MSSTALDESTLLRGVSYWIDSTLTNQDQLAADHPVKALGFLTVGAVSKFVARSVEGAIPEIELSSGDLDSAIEIVSATALRIHLKRTHTQNIPIPTADIGLTMQYHVRIEVGEDLLVTEQGEFTLIPL